MKLTKTSANLLLALITVSWGLGFIFVKICVNNNMSAGIINFFRGFMFMFMILIFFFPKIRKMSFYDFRIGLITGIYNFIGFITQTVGAMYTTPSNNAFLTVTNVLMVPFIVWIFYKKRPPLKRFISILICMYGMAWLTGFIRVNYVINIGDILSIVCAFFFALSIAIIGNSAKDSEFSVIAFMMGLVQMVGSLLYFLIAEGAQIPDINWPPTILPLLFLGVIGSFLAQSGQVIAQKYTSASSAALIMTLEGLFGAIFSVLFGFDVISGSLFLGGSLIMASLFISEIDFKGIRDKRLRKKTL